MKFDHVAVRVDDIDAAIKFYESVAGLKVIRRSQNPAWGIEVAFLDDGKTDEKVELIHWIGDGPFKEHVAHLGMQVENMDEALAAVAKFGATLHFGPLSLPSSPGRLAMAKIPSSDLLVEFIERR